jgi:hypothetical protein
MQMDSTLAKSGLVGFPKNLRNGKGVLDHWKMRAIGKSSLFRVQSSHVGFLVVSRKHIQMIMLLRKFDYTVKLF